MKQVSSICLIEMFPLMKLK